MTTLTRVVGSPLMRLEGPEKVTGTARYAVEHPVDHVAYAWPVAATVSVATITGVDASAALALPGVLAVITHENAPALTPTDDEELSIMQSAHVSYRGELIGGVVAETLEQARAGAEALRISYDEQPHDVELTADHPGLYKPDEVNAGMETDTAKGDFDAAFAAAPMQVDHVYATPAYHNNPMEPHASTAMWADGRLTVWDSTQGSSGVQQALATLFDLPPESVRVYAEQVGGGFGSKGSARPNVVLAAIAARHVQRPVRLALSRRNQFAMVGYRTPTFSRVRLGADADGRLSALGFDVAEQCSHVKEFAEQTAAPARVMYDAANRRTSHRVVALDVPTPRWMRAPGEAPGMYALESAMDELAAAVGVDPVELRVRNEPASDPETGTPWSSRHLVECLREGAARFGWQGRDPTPGVRRDGRWLVGTGVAASTYPVHAMPSTASVEVGSDGRYQVLVNATDIGTGARTALWQIAADTLGAPPERVEIRIGDSSLPKASVAGGSAGTASWGWAVVKACEALRATVADHGGVVPAGGLSADGDIAEDLKAQEEYARHAFGAQFVEVRVDTASGEVRVPRMLGVFAAGHIMNARTARSQLVGGMTMGLGMALLEEGRMDLGFGDYANHDLATYHVPANADIADIEAVWIDEDDPHVNPMGAKGIGEIGIVGTAAAIANAVYHATGIRVRDLPIRLDKLLR